MLPSRIVELYDTEKEKGPHGYFDLYRWRRLGLFPVYLLYPFELLTLDSLDIAKWAKKLLRSHYALFDLHLERRKSIYFFERKSKVVKIFLGKRRQM